MNKKQKKPVVVHITKNGPYRVEGKVTICEVFLMPDITGAIAEYRVGQDKSKTTEPVLLCRCGASKSKPFCDGKHISLGFDGTETAPKISILEQAVSFIGPNLTLYDNEKYCAFARFCDGHGRIWNLVHKGRPETDKHTIREAHQCPAGRLIIYDNQTGLPIEPTEDPFIQVIEDPMIGVHGPLGLRGNIIVFDSENQPYERRNRQTLCRCGRSRNKPFCDGSHALKEKI